MKTADTINQAFQDAERFVALEESYLDRADVSPEEARAWALARRRRKSNQPLLALKGFLLNLLF